MDLDFQSLGFSWNGGVVVKGITLSPMAKEGEKTDPLLTVDEARTNVAISPLLSGKIVVNSVEVNGFSVRVRRNADGTMNLPDFSNLAAATPKRESVRGERSRIQLSAVAAETAPAAPAASALPPIELHRLDLNKGILSYTDAIENLNLDLGVDSFRADGATLNDPFILSGKVIPYPEAPDKGEFPFTGRVAMVKDGAFNPNGEASVEINVKAFSIHELAAKLGLGDLLASGVANGVVKGAYANQKALLSIVDMRLASAAVGMGEGKQLKLPDSSAGLTAEFDPGPGTINLSDIALTNDITALRAKGWIEGVYDLANGQPPVAAIDYTGAADFAKASQYVTEQNLAPAGTLPTVEGKGSYFGKLVLGKREKPSDPLSPTFTLDFSEGQLGVREAATGVAVNVGLTGVGLKATADIGQKVDVNSGLTLKNVPVAAVVPQIGQNPVTLTLNGGAAVTASESAAAAELRLKDTVVKVPATPWAAAMEIKNPETKLTYDLKKDEAAIQALTFDINNSVQGAVGAAVVTGILSGSPQGQAEITLAALLDQVKTIFQPMVPEFATKVAGSLRSATRVKVAGKVAEAATQAEIDTADFALTLPEGMAALDSPKTVVALTAGANLDNPLAITLNSLAVNSTGANLRFADKSGISVAGRLGAGEVKAAGLVDAAGMKTELSGLSLAVNGATIAIYQDNKQAAGMTGGVMQVIAATQDNKLTLPLSGEGDFNVPSLDAGADNLVFFRMVDQKREDSDFGSLRAKVGVDGYIGSGKRQLINLRTAALSAKPFAVNSRGQFDLGTGALVAEYAARMAPAGMASLLGFLKLPPALLTDAAASGTVAWDGSQLATKGSSQGQLRLASGGTSPFEFAHDFTAVYKAADESLAVSVRRLDGNVKTSTGEAVFTLATQPSNLLLSKSGAKGLLDIRLNGAAAPTRMLVLGVLGVIPQLRDYSNLIYNTLAEGVYNAWLQIKDKDADSLALNVGGVWQGAALRVNNVPYLAEAGKLSAALEGDFSFKENRATVSKLFLRSDSALMQADGTAQAVLATDQNRSISGLANVNVDLKFVMADLTKVPLVFPGVVPADLGMTGRIDGAFKAGGNADDIRVGEGAVRFQGFRAKPGGQDIAIPNGTANFGATISLHQNAPAAGGQASEFDVFRMFNIANGQASVTGAQLRGKPINNMSSAFQLQNGVLTLQSAQASIVGDVEGTALASGTVDFNGAAPAANLKVALRNMPLSEVNSEISQYMEIQSGLLNLPGTQGQFADVAFTGLSEDEILRTLRLNNFTFATGPVTLHTGPALNAELDKAKVIMKQQVTANEESRIISLKSITGTAAAAGNGVISFPNEAPITVVGDNTGDFKATGTVSADHQMNIDIYVAGKLENLIGFSLPNLIPNLRSGSDEDKNRFMAKMNENAAKGHYKVNISGPLDQPNLGGIPQLAGMFLADIFKAAPGQIIGGVLELGKDAPGTVLDIGKGAAGALLNAPETIQNAPKTIITAPQNIGKGIGRMFGIGGGSAETPEAAAPQAGQEQAPATTPQQEQQPQEQQEQQGGLRLPFRIR